MPARFATARALLTLLLVLGTGCPFEATERVLGDDDDSVLADDDDAFPDDDDATGDDDDTIADDDDTIADDDDTIADDDDTIADDDDTIADDDDTGPVGVGDVCGFQSIVMTLPSDSHSDTLASTDPSDGPRGPGYYQDDLEFEGGAGDAIHVEVTVGSFDTYLYLLDDTCSVIAEDDDSGAGTLSAIDLDLPADGVYTIVVSSYAQTTTGAYTVILEGAIGPVDETLCDDGLDDDGDGFIDCDDVDCDPDPACAPPPPEICANSLDEDGDGLIDCADPDCAAHPACTGPATETSCANGVDDDGDALIDCSDPDCAADPACTGPTTETSCVNGVDDDGDFLTDCSDPDCAADPACTGPTTETSCVNGVDDDGDAFIDCDDTDCAADPACTGPTTETSCVNGVDDDGDAFIDCDDTDCAADPACALPCTVGSCCYTDSLTLALPQDSYTGDLNALYDDDAGPRGVGYVFDDLEFEGSAGELVRIETTSATFDTYLYLLDEGCAVVASDDDGGDGNLSLIEVTLPASGVYTIVVTSWASGAEGDYTVELNPPVLPTTETACADGLDDDFDGLTDCVDPDCTGDPACPSTETSCTNGTDDDFDGLTDCADTDCAADPACAACAVGSCCYGDTLTLSLPTDSYAGNLLGDATDGPRGSGYQFDDIEFEGSAGDFVTIETTAADFDTYLYLLDEDCTVIASDDDGGAGPLSLIAITLPASGVYTIAVTSFSSGVEGAYTVALNPVSLPANETSCSDGLDDDGDGATDCADDDCETDPACLSCPLGSCCYGDTLTLSMPSDSYSGSLDTVDATGGPRGASYYFDDIEFVLAAGESVTIEITSADFDSYLHLLDDSCNVLDYDDDGGVGLLSRIDFTASYAAVYTVAVSTFSTNTTGAYTVEIY